MFNSSGFVAMLFTNARLRQCRRPEPADMDISPRRASSQGASESTRSTLRFANGIRDPPMNDHRHNAGKLSMPLYSGHDRANPSFSLRDEVDRLRSDTIGHRLKINGSRGVAESPRCPANRLNDDADLHLATVEITQRQGGSLNGQAVSFIENTDRLTDTAIW